MRVCALILACLLFTACAAIRDDMRRAEVAFDEARYEQVVVWLDGLESSVPDMDRPTRARFYYLRGVASYRLGETRRARHFLALCREEAEREGVGLRSEWRVNLAKLLAEIDVNAQNASGGESAKPTAPQG